MKNDVDGKFVTIDGGVMMKDHVAPPNHDQGDARLDPLSKVKSTFRRPLVSKNLLDPAFTCTSICTLMHGTSPLR